MQIAAGKNDFTDKNVNLVNLDKNKNNLNDTVVSDADINEEIKLNNKQFYHKNFPAGKIIEMSDRKYLVAPDGSWRVFRNEDQFLELKAQLASKYYYA